MTPEVRARTRIDTKLWATKWIVHIHDELNLDAGLGAAMREVPTPSGPLANNLIFHKLKPSGSFTAARYNEMLPLAHGLHGMIERLYAESDRDL